MRRKDTGAVLFMVGLLFLYFYGTWSVNQEGKRWQRVQDMRNRVVAYVNKHPEVGEAPIEALRKGGVLSDDDLKFMKTNNVTYHPVGAKSPEDGLVLVVVSPSMENYYYKGGKSDFLIKFVSPDKSLALVNAPHPKIPNFRAVSIVEQKTGNVVGVHDVEGLSLSVQWSPTSRFVALNRSIKGGSHRVVMIAVAPGGTKIVPLPEDLVPEKSLPKEDGVKGVKWFGNDVNAEKWLGERDVEIENYGGATLGDPNAKPPVCVYFRYRFVVRIDEEGKAAIREKSQKSFTRSP